VSDAGKKANEKAARQAAKTRGRFAFVMREYPERQAELNQPKQKRGKAK
jgi:hypothetical protein